jgi:hypothetical protein
MKKRTKNEIQARRFYASGIPMQREQKNLFTVKAGTLVNVILVKTANAICEVKCDKTQKEETGRDSVVVRIPVDNFQGDKIKTPTRKNAKEVKPKVKKNKVDGAPVVDTEPAATETPAPAAVETPAPEPAPAEVAPEMATELAAL